MPEKKSTEMKSVFDDHDSSKDYDKDIDDVRKTVSESEDPCKARYLLLELTHRLNNKYLPTYYSRPCVSGYCMGLFTPHRSRIIARINSLNEEINGVHKNSCDNFNRELEERRRLEHEKQKQIMQFKHEEQMREKELEGVEKLMTR